jgi:hypothetical protein
MIASFIRCARGRAPWSSHTRHLRRAPRASPGPTASCHVAAALSLDRAAAPAPRRAHGGARAGAQDNAGAQSFRRSRLLGSAQDNAGAQSFRRSRLLGSAQDNAGAQSFRRSRLLGSAQDNAQRGGAADSRGPVVGGGSVLVGASVVGGGTGSELRGARAPS